MSDTSTLRMPARRARPRQDAGRRSLLQPWQTFLVGGAAALVLYLLLPAGAPQGVLYVLVGIGGVASILWGVRLNRPQARAPWYLFAAGQTAWVVGDSLFGWYEVVRDVAPFPSVADVAYLVAYPLLAAGIFLFIRRGVRTHDTRALIDSGIVVVGLGVVSWAWIAQPMFETTGVPVLDRTIAVAYPVGDILLMAMLVRLVASPGPVSMALRLLAGAVLAQIVADTALAAGVADSWQYGAGLDLFWLASYILWGASALHPDMDRICQRHGLQSQLFSTRRVLALGSAALVPPVTAAAALATGHSMHAWTFVGGSIVLTLLVLLRMASAVEQVRRTAEQRDHLEGELFQRASRDPLTGLFNRGYLTRLITAALGRSHSVDTTTGLIMVDLDGFKAINGERGPSVADEVLRQTSRRICDAAAPHHVVGRLGGDQFVVLVESAEPAETTQLAGELASSLQRPLDVGGVRMRVPARIGVTLGEDGSADAAGLLHEALIATRRAKLSAPGAFEVFDGSIRQEAALRAEIEETLRAAIDRDELVLHYQPVMAVGVSAIDGYEALVRWSRGADEIVMPDDFIPVAERSDLICDLGRWVLREATRQFADWIAIDPERFAPLTVAVNISGRHLADRCIVDDVTSALSRAGLQGHHLVIEVTETVLIDEPNAVGQLSALRDLGVTISLDDFGTGYASIGQLRHLPVDAIKIDKSFLVSTEPGSAELVALMTAAAHACGMLVVAEGIEREDQLHLLKDLDCDFAQGFFFSRPLTAAKVLEQSDSPQRAMLRLVRD